MSLCDTCLQFTREWTIPLDTTEGQYFGLHSLATAFLDAVESNCYVCNRLFQTLGPEDKVNIRAMAAASLPWVELLFFPAQKIEHFTNERFLTTILFWPLSQRTETIDINVEINKFYSPKTTSAYSNIENINIISWNNFMRRPELVEHAIQWTLVPSSSPGARYHCPSSEDTGSLQTWATLKKWVQDCASTHSKCLSRRSQASWHPTRLINLSGFDKQPNIDVSCKLVDGSDVPASDAYVTLSHRWGGANFIKLTTENLKSFQQSIPIEDLSLTFRQAMQVAGRLGVRYIWIDSLCIIQEGDDSRDWEQEAALMSKVYTNSFCNISADWASESKSLFVTRNLAQFKQVEVVFRVSTGVTLAADSYRSYTTVDSDNWTQQVSNSPLSSRGWFLQEHLLAPRNLRFCLREAFWECCQMTACETYPNSLLPPDLISRDSRAGLKRFEIESDELLSRNDHQQFYNNAWNNIVCQYSQCQLTVPSDKLIAISGIARYFKELINDTYILGFWSKTLSWQLPWFIDHDSHENGQAKTTPLSELSYRSPTFSWASVDGVVMGEPSLNQDRILATVKCIYHRPLTHGRFDDDIEVQEDIFGPISVPTIELKVTGNLKRMKLEPDPNDSKLLLAIPCIGANINAGSSSNRYADAWLDEISDNLESLPLLEQGIFYIPWLEKQDEGGMALSCLILQLVEQEMGRFGRIGMLYVSKDENQDLYLRSQEGEESLPCWAYDSSQGVHTLYIV